MTTATSMGRDPLFLSSSLSKSDRAAAIKIRFADIISGLVLKTDHIDDDRLYDLEEGEIF
uniref:Uncharacterized protein n=1 Tax=Brassica campestris TaxID=3711 RepID=A0A3P5YJB3_BRACM|nr:unnamed protein product [Brassica rapa]